MCGQLSCSDVFVHDRQTGLTSRVSVSSAGVQGNAPSERPTISSDGRFVAFVSSASNLVDGDTATCFSGEFTDNCPDVFVHDRQTGVTSRVSVDSSGAEGDAGSEGPDISGDGRFVAFSSQASNFVAADTNFGSDVFVHDRETGATTLVGKSSGGVQANSLSSEAAISSDGRFVAFSSFASNLVAGDTDCAPIPEDPYFVVNCQDVFVHDRQAGQTTRVSVNSAGKQGNRYSSKPGISSDGRYVVFESAADHLVSGDTNRLIDVFIHDRQTGTTTRASVDSHGLQLTFDSRDSAISGTGRFIAFEAYQVFVRDAGSNDLDEDGVLNSVDNCPTVPNSGGQSADADGDLAGDACDGIGTGDVDCNVAVNSVDALKVLRRNAGLLVVQNEPCLDIGLARQLGPPANWKMGDVDCSGAVNAIDALKVLRAVAGLSVAKPAGCPEVKPPG
jgi:Tol biopolymer transport system component